MRGDNDRSCAIGPHSLSVPLRSPENYNRINERRLSKVSFREDMLSRIDFRDIQRRSCDVNSKANPYISHKSEKQKERILLGYNSLNNLHRELESEMKIKKMLNTIATQQQVKRQCEPDPNILKGKNHVSFSDAASWKPTKFKVAQ